MTNLFDASGTWYKGNLHMHTTRSDGALPPKAAVEVYRNAGYAFLALTDHWVQSENGFENGLLLLSGCEWDSGGIGGPVYHIIGAGMEKDAPLRREEKPGPQAIIDAIRQSGGIAVLAHPAWSVTDPADLLALRGLAGMEIYNSVSGLPWNGRRADSGLYVDLCAAKGALLPCFAADDSHSYDGEQTFSYIMVNAPELTAAALKKALAAGNFYASQGPRFESVTVSGGHVEVCCSPVETVVFYSNTIWCSDRVATGGVNFASYQIKPSDRYVRVELVDGSGRMAWTSPFRVQEG